MTTFDNRERGYENKFAHDQETDFNVIARRNKLLGVWAAEKMNLNEENKKNYISGLVAKTVEHNSSSDIAEQIHEDFLTLEIEITKDEIRKEMESLLHIAREQVINIG